MIKKFELMIALRYLRTKRKDGFISIVNLFSLLGITIGVATLIIVMSVMNGYKIELMNKILGFNGHITIYNYDKKIQNYHEISENIEALDEVLNVSPAISGHAMAASKTLNTGAIIKGITEQDFIQKFGHNEKEESQNLMRNPNLSLKRGEVVLGKHLARKLQLYQNDQIKIILPSFQETVIGLVPRIKTFRVSGIRDFGMHEQNASMIFMNLESAQLLFKYPNSISEMQIYLANHTDVAQVKMKIEKMGDFYITDWQMINQNITKALDIERNVMFLILILIIIVAAFNIISSLIILIKDKSNDIAILRTIGASKFSVIKIFIICGFINGLSGTIIGSVVGITFCLNISHIKTFLESITGLNLFDPVIYFLTKLPCVITFETVSAITATSIMLSFLATIYPSYRAAKLLPSEILRHR